MAFAADAVSNEISIVLFSTIGHSSFAIAVDGPRLSHGMPIDLSRVLADAHSHS